MAIAFIDYKSYKPIRVNATQSIGFCFQAIAFTTNRFDQIMNKDNQQTERPTFDKFKKKALENSEVKKEYEALTLTYQLRKILLSLKKK